MNKRKPKKQGPTSANLQGPGDHHAVSTDIQKLQDDSHKYNYADARNSLCFGFFDNKPDASNSIHSTQKFGSLVSLYRCLYLGREFHPKPTEIREVLNLHNKSVVSFHRYIGYVPYRLKKMTRPEVIALICFLEGRKFI